MTICRVTLFKIPKEEDRKSVLALYRTMQKDALKDGAPYILSVKAGSTFEDQRRQGYNLAVVSEFASEDDMKYYDNDCKAHAALKTVAKPLLEGIMMTYFEPIETSS
ncbi:hypothetical protein McanMca71_004320 [Microsporum canis]|uniref:Stress responsive A/B barrel domain-containing protein n=1 Tax=Arthroderma otae (strain ATCC MYA-4605 / CBS 113480) TaxID=554155 RepID=C5FFI3_ARTOC|nr:stress responsive A/B barrel domain-containing protein [Microsporum canis CBS 113480]EEQ29430.1 stress responsive A/B barrel domain-containing protein [Microsporum canis CBS 113480]